MTAPCPNTLFHTISASTQKAGHFVDHYLKAISGLHQTTAYSNTFSYFTAFLFNQIAAIWQTLFIFTLVFLHQPIFPSHSAFIYCSAWYHSLPVLIINSFYSIPFLAINFFFDILLFQFSLFSRNCSLLPLISLFYPIIYS